MTRSWITRWTETTPYGRARHLEHIAHFGGMKGLLLRLCRRELERERRPFTRSLHLVPFYDRLSRDYTCSGIARVLNGKGLGRRNGKPWTQRQVSAILQRLALYRDGVIRYGEINGQDNRLALLG